MRFLIFFAVFSVASLLYAKNDYGPFKPFQNAEAKYGYTGKNGIIVIEPVFDYAEEFHDGMAVVGNVVNIQNENGGYEPQARFGYIHENSIKKDVYGNVLWNGKFAIDMELTQANRFKGGIAKVCGKICGILGCCVINEDGEYFRDEESYRLRKKFRS